MTIGIATSAAGISFEVIKQADFVQDQVRVFQDNFEKQSLAKLLPLLQQRGLDGEVEVEAELKLSRDSVQVFFPKYNVLANVNFTEEPASSQ